jgi:hypothetical protein
MFWIDRVAQAAHSPNQLRVEPLVDLAAQLPDIDIDDIGEPFEGWKQSRANRSPVKIPC